MPQRKYRKRRDSSDEEERGEQEQEEEVVKKLEETKEFQRFRKRPVGVSAVGLAFGKKFTEEEKMAPDPFKLKSGGLVDLKDIKGSDLEGADDEVMQRLKGTFSQETKTRDDETHMLQYIEDEMAKKKGVAETKDEASSYKAKFDALYQVPDRLNVKETAKTEEMLSNQMLSGIPEVDLGLEAKFRNIEETELAKQKLIEEQSQQKSERVSLVPANMATNFTLHSLRFYKEREPALAAKKKREPAEKPQPAYIPVVGESEPELKPTGVPESHKRKTDHNQLATDDYHYDKYRKRVRHF